jgi:hypothetical protein
MIQNHWRSQPRLQLVSATPHASQQALYKHVHAQTLSPRTTTLAALLLTTQITEIAARATSTRVTSVPTSNTVTIDREFRGVLVPALHPCYL